MTPERLSHYRIIRKIGSGGMGEVHLAEDEVLGRRVAIKILPPDIADHPDRVARFKREARAVSALNHPNILTIHEYGQDAGIHFFVTEYLPGRTVREILRRAPSPSEALAIGISVSTALAAAHATHVVHRDVKPENIIVTETGLVKVLDFGLAERLHDGASPADMSETQTLDGHLAGTVPYMSPEQIRSGAVDGRTDVFGLGVTLYELFEGRKPFHGASAHEVIADILLGTPTPPQRARVASPRLAGLLLRMLAKESAARPDADEVRRELEAIRKEVEGYDLGTPSMTPAGALGAPSPDLPAEVTPLVGRERELAALCATLRRPDVRLVTITGAGGIGKSRLAVGVAARIGSEFPDGTWLVPLEAVDAPDHVAPAIAQVVDARYDANQSVAAALSAHLGPRRALLVIDNFEQVIAAASVVAGILAAAPGVKMLVTSQSPLRIRGEHEYPLEPLEVPARRALAGELSLSPAVALFVERARQIRPDFELTDDNAAAVAEICRLVDGLPLAIELAAVRVKLLAPGAIVERLRDPIAFLTGGPRDLPPRQQALRNAVEWSVGLTSPEERRLFARVSIFQGGATVEAVEAVCDLEGRGPGEIDDRLASLLDKSLLRRDYTAGGERFAMLAGVRAIGRRHLEESGERPAVADRHLAYYTTLVGETEPQLTGAAQPLALQRLAAEENNIRAALQWALSSGHAEAALRLASGMWRFWDVRGLWREGRQTLDRVLAMSGGADLRLRAQAQYAAGVLADAQGDFEASRAAFEQYLELSRGAGNDWGVANALNNLAVSAFRLGRLEEAAARYAESLGCWRALGNTLAVALSLQNVGNLYRARGLRADARVHYGESRATFEEAGDDRGVAHALMLLASLDREEGDLEGARSRYEEALKIFMRLTDHWNVAACMADFGRLMAARLDFAEARGLLEESVLIFRELGDPKSGGRVLESLALLALDEGDRDRAEKLAGAAHAILESIGVEGQIDPRLQEARARGGVRWAEGTRLSFEEAANLAQS